MRETPYSAQDLKLAMRAGLKNLTGSQVAIAWTVLGVAGLVIGSIFALSPMNSNVGGVVTSCGSVMIPKSAAALGQSDCGTLISINASRAAVGVFCGLALLFVTATNGLFARVFTLVCSASAIAVLIGIFSAPNPLFDVALLIFAVATVYYVTRSWNADAMIRAQQGTANNWFSFGRSKKSDVSSRDHGSRESGKVARSMGAEDAKRKPGSTKSSNISDVLGTTKRRK